MIELHSDRRNGITLFVLIYLVASFVTRSLLLLKSAMLVTWNLSILGAFASGLFFDLCVGSFFAIPWTLYLLFLPQRIFKNRIHQALIYVFYFGAIYLFVFGVVSEWVFWDEFGVRFNFIAVDYLVYTTEVIRNIQESYHMGLIYFGVFVVTSIAYALLLRSGALQTFMASESSFRQRWKGMTVFLLVAALLAVGVRQQYLPDFGNNYNRELAKNGVFSLFAAFWHNELDYDQFYITQGIEKSDHLLRNLVAEPNSTFLDDNGLNINRMINNEGVEKRWNVIHITVESLSGEYLAAWGQEKNLMPNLNDLISKSLFFRNFYATGTRTVRGMEALTLSVPPTPGRSIVKRPHNENLFNIGSVFQQKGYECSFLYGGNGYFDNMNEFFSSNGFRILDKPKMSADKISFENAWGACDEDLLDWALEDADRSYSEHKPFYKFIMTTSNHRPYTYPEGKVDIPSGTGRDGAVQYTDYAIGAFLKKAAQKPWFNNTVFIIVADHCAGSARKQELAVKKYEIPLIIYAPSLIKPQVVTKLSSQIDVAPTLFGLMNWSYKSKFYGKDIMRMPANEGRALIGNYQKLALLKDHSLAVIKPVKQFVNYQCDRETGYLSLDAKTPDVLAEILAYYQTASTFFKSGGLSDFE